MTKRVLFFWALLIPFASIAQTFSVSGAVADADGAPLEGASLVLRSLRTNQALGQTTQAGGRFLFDKLEKGAYTLEATHIGFLKEEKRIRIADTSIFTGIWRLRPDAQTLKEVEVKEKIPVAVQRGDTMEINAGAFKVMKDASAEELLEKMPSVSNDNGQIKAQGENVQQVLVDGKPFFGNDATAALRNLPAELIEKVQIYDAQSDQAQFTGFNDGVTVKTINLVTKAGMRNGQFGKAYAGYGYEDKYQAGGNISYFDGDRRLSLVGMSNNINVQNFAAEDIVGSNSGARGAGRQAGRRQGGGRRNAQDNNGGNNNTNAGDFLVNAAGGLATTHAAGLNYSDRWGKKTEVSGSYFFNNSISDATETLHRQFLSDEAAQIYDENNRSTTNNVNHRFNMRVERQIDSARSILWRPRLSFQKNGSDTYTSGATLLNAQDLNRTDNTYNADLDGLNIAQALLYRHRFLKKGRTASIDMSGAYAPKNGHSRLYSLNDYFNQMPPLSDSIDQQSILDQNSWNIAGNIEYTEPVGEKSQLMLSYRGAFQQEASDRFIYDGSTFSGVYEDLNETLSNVFSNDYISQAAGFGYNYTEGRDFNLSVRFSAQWADLYNDQAFPLATVVEKNFVNVLPSASLRYNIDKNRNLRFNYRSNTQLPSVEQLQDVVNNTNPLQLTSGNPDLKQAEQHNVFVRYQSSRPDKSSAFFLMLGGGLTRHYIGAGTWLAGSDHPVFNQPGVQPGAQFTQAINLDGYYTLRSLLTYSFPVKKLRSNLNIDLSYNYARMPGLINDQLNQADLNSFGSGLTLSSNVSDQVDFMVSVRPAWQKANNSQTGFSSTEYLSQNTRARLNWQIWEGFVLRTDLRHTLLSGFSDGFNQNYWLWNLAIGKKLFKNERGEISLAINDLLNQNRNVARTVTEVYIEDVQTNALTRFVMLSFTYNLRHFNTGKQAAPERRRAQQRRMGD